MKTKINYLSSCTFSSFLSFLEWYNFCLEHNIMKSLFLILIIGVIGS